MKVETLYRSANLRLFRNGPRHDCLDTLVVCFQYKQADQHLELPGFAENFFEQSHIDAVFVNCATNEWYQYDDLPKVLSTVRDFASSWTRTLTYGSSMGGYAALRFAAAVGATSSIAIGPQYSPRSLIVPGEARYDAFVADTHFLHEDYYRASTNVCNYVIYDPLLTVDRRHVMMYQAEAMLIRIPIPCGGHTPTILLAESGLLKDVILRILAGTFCPSRFRVECRRTRRSSPQYWKELIEHLRERGRWRTTAMDQRTSTKTRTE